MKHYLVLLFIFFIINSLLSQNKNDSNIPDNLLASWVIEQPGEGQVPSQIFKWKFSKINSNRGECQFHWLFKRQEDKEFIAVAVLVSNFSVNDDEISTKLTKVGSMQKEPMKMEFYEDVKWHYPGDKLFEMTDGKEMSFHFKIEDDIFLVFEDHNNDGDYEDEGETQKYLKEGSLFK